MLPTDKIVTEKKTKILTEWLENNFRNKGTKEQYKVALLNFLQSFYSENEYTSINQTDEGVGRYLKEKERNFLDDLKKMVRFMDSKGYAPSTINGTVTVVRVFFEEHGHEIPKKEWKQLRRLLPTSAAITQDKILTKEQMRRVLAHLPINGRAIAFFLLSSGSRTGETLQLKKENLDLDADPPEASFRATTTKKGVGGRTVFMSYEARDAVKEWLALKDSRFKTGGYGKYAKDLVFGSSGRGFQAMWNLALKKASLALRDSETKIHVYHVHTLRKFFETNMSLAGVPNDIYEAWMGHTGYLGGAYKRYSKEQTAKIYKDHMNAVTIYGSSIDSEFMKKLNAVEEEVKTKDAELSKVNEMLDKLGIPNDRPLEQRLLEYFRITQTRQIENTSQPIKSEPSTLPMQPKSSEVSMEQPEKTSKLDEEMEKLGYVQIEQPKPIREPVKFSSDGMSVRCKGIYYDAWVGKEICAVCQDKECEIKKGTVTFPKQKPRTQYPLKRW